MIRTSIDHRVARTLNPNWIAKGIDGNRPGHIKIGLKNQNSPYLHLWSQKFSTMLNSICVFCGSSSGHDPLYTKAAAELGKAIAQRGLRLVYGGGSVGLMGVLANAVLSHGGEVVGVIPQFLYDKEVGLDTVTELRIVASMHERKQQMAELSQAFVALPGGIGTMEELFEIFTWAQLALIKKPVAVLNIRNFFDSMIELLDHMVKEGFLKTEHRQSLITSTEIDDLFDLIYQFSYAETAKWIDKT
jgi:uncharacterized protein (TIGR00730 family)